MERRRPASRLSQQVREEMVKTKLEKAVSLDKKKKNRVKGV